MLVFICLMNIRHAVNEGKWEEVRDSGVLQGNLTQDLVLLNPVL